MIIEADEVEQDQTLEADVCVVGGGPAGISIAGELAGSPLRVVLLESGGLEGDTETQSLYEGNRLGAPQWPLDTTRLRLLGGSSNHWSGLCRPFDDLDLRERPWVPHSGWPLLAGDLQRHYPRAFQICSLPPFNHFSARSRSALVDPGEALRAEGVELKLAYQSATIRFGKRYRALLDGPSLRVLLHANATEFVPNAEVRRLSRVEVRTLTGRRFSVTARAYVLACGAIENARLLLLSNRVNPRGLGNDRDLVGRFYMDHPSAKPLALLQYFGERSPRVPWAAMKKQAQWIRSIGWSDEVQEREQLLNGAVYVWEPRDADGIGEFQWMGRKLLEPEDDVTLRFLQRLGEGRGPVEAAFCWLESEEAPNPDSRVTLGDRVDRLGQRRVVVDWRPTDLNRRSMARTGRLLAESFGRSGTGRIKLWPWLLDAAPDWWSHLFPGGWHPMGTTRMAEHPGSGVVDPNCRVFGLDNLFVAGGSVFPTGSYDSPTVTLVALAVRLAHHLKDTLLR